MHMLIVFINRDVAFDFLHDAGCKVLLYLSVNHESAIRAPDLVDQISFLHLILITTLLHRTHRNLFEKSGRYRGQSRVYS